MESIGEECRLHIEQYKILIKACLTRALTLVDEHPVSKEAIFKGCMAEIASGNFKEFIDDLLPAFDDHVDDATIIFMLRSLGWDDAMMLDMLNEDAWIFSHRLVRLLQKPHNKTWTTDPAHEAIDLLSACRGFSDADILGHLIEAEWSSEDIMAGLHEARVTYWGYDRIVQAMIDNKWLDVNIVQALSEGSFSDYEIIQALDKLGWGYARILDVMNKATWQEERIAQAIVSYPDWYTPYCVDMVETMRGAEGWSNELVNAIQQRIIRIYPMPEENIAAAFKEVSTALQEVAAAFEGVSEK
jgi:hypothetical protein